MGRLWKWLSLRRLKHYSNFFNLDTFYSYMFEGSSQIVRRNITIASYLESFRLFNPIRSVAINTYQVKGSRFIIVEKSWAETFTKSLFFPHSSFFIIHSRFLFLYFSFFILPFSFFLFHSSFFIHHSSFSFLFRVSI